MVLGLALYGYKVRKWYLTRCKNTLNILYMFIICDVILKVMKTIGYKLTALSPSRGASAELAASLTVVTASYIGLPVSIISQSML